MNWRFLLKGTEDKNFKFLGLAFIAFYLFYVGLSIYDGVPELSLWFCITSALLFGIGLYYKNTLLLSATVVSSFIINLPLAIDLISYSLTGTLVIGSGSYVIALSPLRYIMTFYHIFLLVLPVYVIFLVKDFHKYAWLFSTLHYFLLSVLTLLVTTPENFVNFVLGPASLGIFNFMYALKLNQIPYFVFNWIFVSVFIFLTTHIVFMLIVKKLKAKAKS